MHVQHGKLLQCV